MFGDFYLDDSELSNGEEKEEAENAMEWFYEELKKRKDQLLK